MKATFDDLRHALRMLRATPLLSTLAILITSIGIGPTTSVFNVYYGVLHRPVPVPGG